jgi:putative flavoprotein involved in K+ transport
MPENNVNRPISHVLETLEAALRRGDTAAAV